MLKIKISSFSYVYGTIPADDSGNGGGFVFDCRALPNPGRYAEYKELTGMDEPVATYLMKETEVKLFLDNSFALVDQAVTRYLDRGFTSLMVSFGCTGGQHRSVFSAEQLSLYLADKYEDIIIDLRHWAREAAAKK